MSSTITSMSTKLASDLRDLLGDEIVADDPNSIAAHSGDKWFATHPPDLVVFARSTEDVSKLLHFASREKVPVTARGGGCTSARNASSTLPPRSRCACFRFRRHARRCQRRSPRLLKLPKLYTQSLQLDFYRQHSKSLII